MEVLSEKRKGLAVTALVFAAVFLSYFNALSNGFAYDDLPIIKLNPALRDLGNIPHVFTSGYWSSFGEAGGLWRPLSLLTYMFEFAVAGDNPVLYHLDNIVLHFMCCMMVYILMRRLAGGHLGPAAAALLFAVHTVHVEAVANVVGRAEMLASFFAMAGLYVFIRPPRRAPWYVLSPLLMLLGLLSKETAVVLPLLIIAYLAAFERDGRGKSLLSIAACMAPYALVTAAYLAARYFVLGTETSPQNLGQVLVFTKGYWRMLVMFRVFLDYIRLSLFPTNLQLHYMLRPPESILSAVPLAFLAITAAFAAVSPRLMKRRPAHFFFGAWFFITLIPVSNIVPIGILMSERAMYLPLVSFCALAGLAFSYAAGGVSPSRAALRGSTAVALFVVSLAAFTLMTHERNKVWRDTRSVNLALVTSFKKVTAEFPESGLYYTHLAKTYGDLGMKEEEFEAYKTAVALEPRSYYNHLMLAEYYERMRDPANALKEVKTALSITNRDYILENAEPVYSAMIAEIYYRNGMEDEAEPFIREALSADLGEVHESYANIGLYLRDMGMLEDAERYLTKAVELDPLIATYRLNYGFILSEKGDLDGAMAQFMAATELDPDMAEAYYGQGEILGYRGEFLAAAGVLEKAVRLKPGETKYRYYLAAAYAEAGLTDKAEEELRETLRLQPDNAQARELLDALE